MTIDTVGSAQVQPTVTPLAAAASDTAPFTRKPPVHWLGTTQDKPAQTDPGSTVVVAAVVGVVVVVVMVVVVVVVEMEDPVPVVVLPVPTVVVLVVVATVVVVSGDPGTRPKTCTPLLSSTTWLRPANDQSLPRFQRAACAVLAPCRVKRTYRIRGIIHQSS